MLRLGRGLPVDRIFPATRRIARVDFFQEMVRKNVKIQGVWVSGTRHTFQALSLIEKQQNLFGKMITHRFKLDEANEALAAMESSEALKAVLIPRAKL